MTPSRDIRRQINRIAVVCYTPASCQSSWSGLAAGAAALLLLSSFAVQAQQASPSAASRLAQIKDVATIEGIRDNQLVGYGIVVGLRGTGDSSQTVFPIQTLITTDRKSVV